MKHPKLIHHGAREGVTGSCHQLWMDENSSVLIDCGQFQGDDEAGTKMSWRWISPSRVSRR